MRARLTRSHRLDVRHSHVAVVNMDPSGTQGLVNWKNCRSITPGQRIADAVCDTPHHWCIYLAALCIDQFGQRYIKAIEVEPQGYHLAARLTEVIETYYRGLLDECNPLHLAGFVWIANPGGESMTEEQAEKIIDAVGAWGPANLEAILNDPQAPWALSRSAA
ncbi:hypothetical protein L682_27150 [Aquipseudomonas alcaligenes OT 69]|nr:hypothetical protein L682_27150 [Pseudomonas alcaligenes OT 69]